jgi:dihydrodipicolinate synthase/N-acetylneuraminate lyase
LYDNYLAENADQVQERLDRYREATRDYAAIPALKQIMANRTGDRTWLNLRPPLVNLSEAATHEMLAKYAAA